MPQTSAGLTKNNNKLNKSKALLLLNQLLQAQKQIIRRSKVGLQKILMKWQRFSKL
jgi:hypothetical protein